MFLTPVSGHNCLPGVGKNYGVFQFVFTSQVFSAGEKDGVFPSRSGQTSSVRVRLVGFQGDSQCHSYSFNSCVGH